MNYFNYDLGSSWSIEIPLSDIDFFEYCDYYQIN